MKTLLIAVALLGSPVAGSVASAAGQAAADHLPMDRCVAGRPARATREAGGAYGRRASVACEVQWTNGLTARRTDGQTHDEFVDACLRRCVKIHGATSGAPLGYLLGGIAAAALAGGVTAGFGGGGPNTPPASP
jgi:hypothetical protein